MIDASGLRVTFQFSLSAMCCSVDAGFYLGSSCLLRLWGFVLVIDACTRNSVCGWRDTLLFNAAVNKYCFAYLC